MTVVTVGKVVTVVAVVTLVTVVTVVIKTNTDERRKQLLKKYI